MVVRGSLQTLLLDVREAADTLRVSRSRLYQLINSGALESVKLGKKRLIPAGALEAFVEGLRDAPRGGDR